MPQKYVYAFEEGGKEQKYLLGGKGANLAEMTNLGLPGAARLHDHAPTRATPTWPPATSCPTGLMDEVAAARERARAEDGQDARRRRRPAARVGALGRAVLDAGDDGHRPQPRAQRRVGEGPRRSRRSNERFAYDSYRRFVQMFGKIVLDVPGDLFEEALHDLVEAKGVSGRHRARAPRTSRGSSRRSRRSCRSEAGVDFPTDPQRAARATRSKPCSSRGTASARATTAGCEGIPDDLGTAVNVQTMVFGNKGDDSGTGVAFTRNPSTGENLPYGDFLDERAGRRRRRRHPHHRAARRDGQRLPRVAHEQLLGVMKQLENHYRDMCDIEFTIEQGRLFMLQTRVGKRTAAAALRMAVEMVERGPHRQARSGAARAARAARPAAAPAVRPEGRVRRCSPRA